MRHDRCVKVPASLIAISCSTLNACAGDVAPDQAPIVRDSAGIQIVENVAPCWTHGAGWRLSNDPVTAIGAVEGDPGQDLYQVTGALRLSDGRIVVTNRGTYELRFFTPDGRYLFAAGSQGGGPGEFSGRIGPVFAGPADSLVVYEPGRLSVFDANGQHVRTYPMPSGDEPSVRSAVGIFGDGSMLVGMRHSPIQAYTTTGPQRDSITYYRADSGGQLIDTLGQFFANDLFVHIMPNGFIALSLPFGRDGAASVVGETFTYGSTEAYEFRIHSRIGRLLRIIRLTHDGVPLTAAMLDSARSERLSRAEDSDEIARARMMIEASSSFDTLPAFVSFTVDLVNNIWVLQPRRGDDQPRQWIVFSGDGVCLGTVDTPPRLTVYEIGSDYLLGEVTDTMGIERIEMYDLVKDSQVVR